MVEDIPIYNIIVFLFIITSLSIKTPMFSNSICFPSFIFDYAGTVFLDSFDLSRLFLVTCSKPFSEIQPQSSRNSPAKFCKKSIS